MRWLKISDATNATSPFVFHIEDHILKEGLKNTVFLRAGDLVLSNSASPGIPKFLGVDSCIHDGWLYFPRSRLSKVFLYLFFEKYREALVPQGNGSVFNFQIHFVLFRDEQIQHFKQNIGLFCG